MKYFKHVEVADIYHVSEKSVRNWIDAARKGKIALDLHEQDDKYYVANTTNNQTVIKQLVERGQRYKNSRAIKTVRPKSAFYELYGPEQVFDIFSNIDVHREIPLQYTYFDGGAHQWDLYTQRLLNEESPNILTSTIRLLETSFDYISHLARGYGRVNIVDLGVGNALPVRNFLARMVKEGFAVKYIGVDSSEEMLKIADENIRQWFSGGITFEQHLLDISTDQFNHLLADDAFTTKDKSAFNIILLLGGTLTNFRSPQHSLQLVQNSLGRNDVFLYADKLDSNSARRYFDFYKSANNSLSPRHRFILDLLNIDESMYEVEQFFDKIKCTRFIRIKLKVDLRIDFGLANQDKFITIYKGEGIVLWRALHQTSLEIINEFDKAGFSLLQATKTPDQEYLLAISKVKTELPDAPLGM